MKITCNLKMRTFAAQVALALRIKLSTQSWQFQGSGLPMPAVGWGPLKSGKSICRPTYKYVVAYVYVYVHAYLHTHIHTHQIHMYIYTCM